MSAPRRTEPTHQTGEASGRPSPQRGDSAKGSEIPEAIAHATHAGHRVEVHLSQRSIAAQRRPPPARSQPVQPAGASAPRRVPSPEIFAHPAVFTYQRVKADGLEAQGRSKTASIDHSCAGLAGAWFQPAATRRSTRTDRSTSWQGLEGTGWRHCTGLTLNPVISWELAALARRPSHARASGGALLAQGCK